MPVGSEVVQPSKGSRPEGVYVGIEMSGWWGTYLVNVPPTNLELFTAVWCLNHRPHYAHTLRSSHSVKKGYIFQFPTY